MFKTNLFIYFLIISFSSLAKESAEGNIIINNEAQSSSGNQNVITAPALIPSDSDKLRTLRQKQEIETEDSILKELEKQRILDERKRFHNIFNKETSSDKASPAPSSPPLQTPVKQRFFFEEKSFFALGAGLVNYYNVTNVNSTEVPAFLFSFGGYGYKERIIFDVSAYYAVHYLKTPHENYQDIRERLHEPSLAISLKYVLLKGKAKPYLGLTGALVGRKWNFAYKDGSELDSEKINRKIIDIARKTWHLSLNGGLAMGADVVLGKSLGLNVDIRYYLNLYTENRKTISEALTDEQILDERDVIIVSINLKYFFN